MRAFVLLLIMNCVIPLSKVQPSGSADYFDNVMTKFMINNRTDALKTEVHLFFTITTDQDDQAYSSVKRGETPCIKSELNLFQPKRFRELQLRELQTTTYNNSRINFLDRFSENNLYSIWNFL